MPLVSEERVLGVIVIRRAEARPFTAGQIAALESFADQAAIAIGHARLFQEVTEALERERATGAILRVIASSPTTVDPVFDAILDSALSLCASPVREPLPLRRRGIPAGRPPGRARRPGRGVATAAAVMARTLRPTRAVTERRPVQIVDMMADRAYAERDPIRVQAVELLGARTALFVPMLKDGTPIGVLVIWRREVRAFSESQIQLLSTFADQAVIALENVRLFTELEARNRELTEALEQQTATSEVLQVISRSTFDLQPVLDTLIENATRLSGARLGVIYAARWRLLSRGRLPQCDTGTHRLPQDSPSHAPGRHTITARAALERRTIHVADLQADPEYELRPARRQSDQDRRLACRCSGVTTILGVIILYKLEVQPFTDKQIELVKTFADQAVIAIENVRLFQELEARNRDLTEALEQQTATAEILRVISSSPTDLQPVMDVVAESAARFCGATDASIWRLEGESLRLVAVHGTQPTTTADRRDDRPLPLDP